MSLPSLGRNHFYRALSQTRRRTGIDVHLDPHEVSRITANHHSLILERDDSLRDVVVAAASVILCSCIVNRPVSGDPLTQLYFGLELVAAWLAEINFSLDLSDHVAAELELLTIEHSTRQETSLPMFSDSEIDTICGLLEDNAIIHDTPFDKTTAEYLGAFQAEPVRVKISYAVTHSDEVAKIENRRFSQALALALSALGILVYQPRHSEDPELDDSESDDPAWREINDAQVAESDLLIQIAEPPSSGVGAVGEMAQRHGVPRLVIYRDGSRVAPLLLGTEQPPALAKWELDNEAGLIEMINSVMPTATDHRQRRIENFKFRAAEIEMLGFGVGLDDDEGDIADVTSNRIRRLRTNPYLFDGMTLREYRALFAIGTLPAPPIAQDFALEFALPHLDRAEARSMDLVAQELHLSPQDRLLLEVEARKILIASESAAADSNRRAVNATRRRFWLRLAQQLGLIS